MRTLVLTILLSASVAYCATVSVYVGNADNPQKAALSTKGEKQNSQPILRGDLTNAPNTNYFVITLSPTDAEKAEFSDSGLLLVERIHGVGGTYDSTRGGVVENITIEKVNPYPADFFKSWVKPIPKEEVKKST